MLGIIKFTLITIWQNFKCIQIVNQIKLVNLQKDKITSYIAEHIISSTKFHLTNLATKQIPT